ncbi:hypothetical protein E2320_003444 [Naja naja]|nr:hypothetical protein E2320_003444 [Naja naja]
METWESYIEGFNCFLDANNLVELTSSKHRVLFLNFCGKHMFNTAKTLLVSQPLSTVSWNELMAKLKNHYAPMPSQIAQSMHSTDLIKLKESRSTNMCQDSERLPCTVNLRSWMMSY